jgi:beta-glucosidase
MLKGSFDFIGIDYCTSTYASDIPCNTENLSYSTGYCVNLTSK